jgi:hypothetical protein
MRFLPPNTHSKKGRREAALLVPFETEEKTIRPREGRELQEVLVLVKEISAV